VVEEIGKKAIRRQGRVSKMAGRARSVPTWTVSIWVPAFSIEKETWQVASGREKKWESKQS